MNDYTINRTIYILRKQKRLSRDKLAKLAGVSQINLFRIENCEVQPRLETVKKIMAALDKTDKIPEAIRVEDCIVNHQLFLKRIERGFGGSELAKLAGILPSTLSMIEHNRVRLKYPVAHKLFSILEDDSIQPKTRNLDYTLWLRMPKAHHDKLLTLAGCQKEVGVLIREAIRKYLENREEGERHGLL